MIEDYEDEEWIEDEDDDADDLMVCPSCHAAVHEDTQKCPNCGDWIVPVYPGHPAKRIIVVCAALLVIVALILLTVR